MFSSLIRVNLLRGLLRIGGLGFNPSGRATSRFITVII